MHIDMTQHSGKLVFDALLPPLIYEGGGPAGRGEKNAGVSPKSGYSPYSPPPQCAHWGTPLASEGGKAAVLA